jgi:glycyl-tRNA synthetase
MSDVNLETIVSLCKRRGFIYQGSEIYGGLAGTWDYGPLGTLLKRHIVAEWLKFFVDGWDDMYQVDTAILMNPKVWQASGHATGFNDPMVECLNCHSRLRQDHIKDDKCPVCGTKGKFSEPRQFNMMFKTNVGPVDDEASVSYLRPETAQGIFTNYKNILDSFYPDLPFGVAQIGKAFRNEISPRDFVFRSREFEQMEIEYFVDPAKWEPAFEHWRKDVHVFLEKKLGLPADKIHELEVPDVDRAHYSKRTIDFEFDFPIGREELLGLAYRTDFDLMNIQEATGKSMEYRPKEGGAAFVPHVIEPSFGVERAVMAVLCNAYSEDEINGEKRAFLKLPAHLAPVKVAVSPLLKNKPELVAKAQEVYKTLKKDFKNVMYDDNGNIGKRYRRQDEIGTPHCVTIDFDTLQDDTVTVRNRDTTEQQRVITSELIVAIKNLMDKKVTK